MTLYFQTGRFDEAADLVKRHHYSRRLPSNVQMVGTLHEHGGLFGDYGKAVAAVFFSIPATRWSYSVLELSRLVQDGSKPPLSMLIACACRVLRKRGADLLVSLADKTQGHHGGVYQAASWNYAGCRDRRIDGLIVDGVFVPGRTCNHRWGTRSPSKVSSILGREVLPHYDEGKHLYWKALGPRGAGKAADLQLEAKKYLKPTICEDSATAAKSAPGGSPAEGKPDETTDRSAGVFAKPVGALTKCASLPGRSRVNA